MVLPFKLNHLKALSRVLNVSTYLKCNTCRANLIYLFLGVKLDNLQFKHIRYFIPPFTKEQKVNVDNFL